MGTHDGLQLPPGAPDAVIVVALRQLDEERCTVLAYVVSSVDSAGCIPFAPDVWPSLLDHLPHDKRRGD